MGSSFSQNTETVIIEVPSRTSKGYLNLLEKVRKLKEELITEEYIVIDSISEV